MSAHHNSKVTASHSASIHHNSKVTASDATQHCHSASIHDIAVIIFEGKCLWKV